MKCCGIHSPASPFLSFEVNNTKKKNVTSKLQLALGPGDFPVRKL